MQNYATHKVNWMPLVSGGMLSGSGTPHPGLGVLHRLPDNPGDYKAKRRPFVMCYQSGKRERVEFASTVNRAMGKGTEFVFLTG